MAAGGSEQELPNSQGGGTPGADAAVAAGDGDKEPPDSQGGGTPGAKAPAAPRRRGKGRPDSKGGGTRGVGAAMAPSRIDRGPPDALQNRFQAERANKERQWRLVFTQYTVNPLRPVHLVTGKAMSRHENIHDPTHDEFIDLIHRGALVPRNKYPKPQTEGQEIGWHTTPLVPFDRSDCRFYFPRRITEITINGYPPPREDKSMD